MTKAVYMYDDNNHFTSTKLVADDYQISGNETFVKVPDGQYQPSTFTGTEWLGTDKATWQATQDAATAAYLQAHPELAPQPSSEQLMINALGQQVASLTMQLAQANTATSDTATSDAATSTAPADDSTTSTAPASDTTTTDNGGAA